MEHRYCFVAQGISGDLGLVTGSLGEDWDRSVEPGFLDQPVWGEP